MRKTLIPSPPPPPTRNIKESKPLPPPIWDGTGIEPLWHYSARVTKKAPPPEPKTPIRCVVIHEPTIWKKLHTAFIQIRNKLLLYLGFTLVNKHGYTVRLVKGQQIMSNPKRVKPYSLDDPSWRIQKG